MADRDRPRRAGDDATGGFLHRWSRRKAEARSAKTPAAGEDGIPAAETAPAPPQDVHQQDVPASVDPKDLPDIESLDASSDFTVFMRPGVPANLRTLALRKLWQSNPIFSKLDGLVEYGEDYTIASWPKGTIETAYRIGRGFVNQLETAEDASTEPGSESSQIGGPAPGSGPAVASTLEEPAGSPAEPPQPAPNPIGPNEARLPPEPQAEPAATKAPARRRPRPLPRRS